MELKEAANKDAETVLQVKQQSAILEMDNQSAIKPIKSGQLNKRTKHIAVRYHFISELNHEGLFDLKYYPSNKQLTDILTKLLGTDKFPKIRNMVVFTACEIQRSSITFTFPSYEQEPLGINTPGTSAITRQDSLGVMQRNQPQKVARELGTQRV
ncbi:hypothetical protein J437_LFUL010254 [Ladona fulva]|uniref:Copia protein n=1 Tax=Ladona fulva TaxID=123851 RepID=A0A8K0KBE0_LADFU|nr:hypothetical protein J437_LFUL010254 [Ladona fulva]